MFALMETADKRIWTIGHSTRTPEHFLSMLRSFDILLVVDIRSFPGSRRYPHFNKEQLEVWLPENGIQYLHIKKLGGRRPSKPDSNNTAWRNAAFRGYADYMETKEFTQGIQELEAVAAEKRTAYMCSEAVWWRCHRSLVSDFLKVEGWTVFHIMDIGRGEEHRFTSPAKIINGKLSYQ